MKKISMLLMGLILVTFTGCSSVIATRTTFNVEKANLNDDQMLDIVESILEEEGMMVSNMEIVNDSKVVKATYMTESGKEVTTGEQVLGTALDYFIGHDELKLYFVLDDDKMYLYGTLKNIKNQIIKETYTYVDMTQEFGDPSLAKMNKIAKRIKEETGLSGRIWNTTGKGLGSEYGVN